tara:strand:+ start:325 stop:813 length:489 start_codon:yes stop_codon:yes gene_type:complete
MASTGQNFAIHSLDKFSVKFTITDNLSALNAGGTDGWWGVATAANSNSSGVKMQKSSGTFTVSSQGGAVQVQDHGGLSISSNGITCEAALNNGTSGTRITGSVAFLPLQPAITDGLTGAYPQTFFHELVYSGTGDADSSTVVATGTLTIHRSLFTSVGRYRR